MGYMMVDNRGAGGELVEFDTVSCKHCQRAMRVVRRARTGLLCMRCAGPVCETCGPGPCTPFVQKLEAAINARHGRDEFAKAAGLATQ